MGSSHRRQRARLKARRNKALLLGAAIGTAALVGVFALLAGPGDDATVAGETALGDPALEVRLTDFEGKEFSLQDYEGRPVVVNFWSSWCPFCAAEMPDFEKVHRSIGDEVAFLGIDQCESCGGGSADAA